MPICIKPIVLARSKYSDFVAPVSEWLLKNIKDGTSV